MCPPLSPYISLSGILATKLVTARIASTHWSKVLAARDGTDSEARRALEELCTTYWMPLYAYSRGLGHDPDQAEDLTQGFFTYLLDKEILRSVDPEKGRFRSFLFASIKHFIAHQHRKEQTLKRGGETTTIPIDSHDAERSLAEAPTEHMDPERAFEYHWGLTVLRGALERLRADWQARDNGALFEALVPHLTGSEPRRPLKELGAALGLSETATRGAMYRLRQGYGRLIRAQIAETVATSDEIDDEVRHLLEVVRLEGVA